MTRRTRRNPGSSFQPVLDNEPEEVLDEQEEDENERDQEDQDEEAPAPRVLIGRVADLGAYAPRPMSEHEASLVLWFLLTGDANLVGVFSRYPEGSLPSGRSEAILAAMRKFSIDRSAELQQLLGVSDGVQYGFHIDASLDQVAESFEDDGFEIVGVLRDGEFMTEYE